MALYYNESQAKGHRLGKEIPANSAFTDVSTGIAL